MPGGGGGATIRSSSGCASAPAAGSIRAVTVSVIAIARMKHTPRFSSYRSEAPVRQQKIDRRYSSGASTIGS
jgi:hypothetical protein